MAALFTTIIYQPFFNLLVGVYYGLNQIPGNTYADIGVALILFTLALRMILLPLTISATRSEGERREIEETVARLKHEYRHDPATQKQLIRQVLMGNRRVVVSEIVQFTIQAIIFFMLYRLFTKGLLGADFHLLYPFMPPIDAPLKLTFLGKFDLTHPNVTLNFIQSGVIFAVELLGALTSPTPVSRRDFIRLLIILPVISFIIFANLPAGKKVFIITTLTFSFCYSLLRTIRRWFRKGTVPILTTPSA